MNSCDHFCQKEDEKADDAPEDFSLDQNEGEMDFSLPSKKKKKKKVILTEGDDFPTEEGGKFSKKCGQFCQYGNVLLHSVGNRPGGHQVEINSFWK